MNPFFDNTVWGGFWTDLDQTKLGSCSGRVTLKIPSFTNWPAGYSVCCRRKSVIFSLFNLPRSFTAILFTAISRSGSSWAKEKIPSWLLHRKGVRRGAEGCAELYNEVRGATSLDLDPGYKREIAVNEFTSNLLALSKKRARPKNWNSGRIWTRRFHTPGLQAQLGTTRLVTPLKGVDAHGPIFDRLACQIAAPENAVKNPF